MHRSSILEKCKQDKYRKCNTKAQNNKNAVKQIQEENIKSSRRDKGRYIYLREPPIKLTDICSTESQKPVKYHSLSKWWRKTKQKNKITKLELGIL